MAYHHSKKRRKLWFEQANAKQERERLAGAAPQPPVEVDPYLKIEVTRRGTGEHVVFECFEGERIDNYRVYLNGDYLGVQSISTLTKNIRKALPSFRRMD